MFQFGGLGVLFGGDKPPKAPRGDGTGYNDSLHAFLWNISSALNTY